MLIGLSSQGQNDTTIKVKLDLSKNIEKRKNIIYIYPIRIQPDYYWEPYDIGFGLEHLFSNSSSAYFFIKGGLKFTEYEHDNILIITAGYRFYFRRDFHLKTIGPNDYYLQKTLDQPQGFYLGTLANYYRLHSSYLHHSIYNPEIFGKTNYHYEHTLGLGISFGYQHIISNRLAIHIETTAAYSFCFEYSIMDGRGVRGERFSKQIIPMVNLGIGYAF